MTPTMRHAVRTSVGPCSSLGLLLHLVSSSGGRRGCLFSRYSVRSLASLPSTPFSASDDSNDGAAQAPWPPHQRRHLAQVPGAALVPVSADREGSEAMAPDGIEVKSLVFVEAGAFPDIVDPTTAVVAVVRAEDRVVPSLLAACLEEEGPRESGADGPGASRDRNPRRQRPSLRLAPPALAMELTGFTIGSIPPVFHRVCLPVVVDRAVVDGPSRVVVGGGGSEGWRLRIGTDALLSLPEVRQWVITQPRGTSVTTEAHSVPGDPTTVAQAAATTEPFGSALPTSRLPQKGPRVAFPARIAEGHVQEARVTFVARIVALRRMSKRLVFADLEPTVRVSLPNGGAATADREDAGLGEPMWVCPGMPLPFLESSTDCSEGTTQDEASWDESGDVVRVQALFGRTFLRQVGEDAALPAMKELRPGQTIFIDGLLGANGVFGQANWQEKRIIDVLVSWFGLLGPQPPSPPPRPLAGTPPVEPRDEPRVKSPREIFATPAPSRNLSLSDVYSDGAAAVIDVADGASLRRMLSDLRSKAAASRDQQCRSAFVGVDSEWKPETSKDASNPVALIQIASSDRAYLIDVQALARPGLPEGTPLLGEEAALSEVLSAIWRAPDLVKVGFALNHDLKRIFASFPHLAPGLGEAVAVLDLAAFARAALPSASSVATRSLARLCETVAGAGMCKEAQRSDWSRRPLLPSQRAYAALDAAVLSWLATRLFVGLGAAGTFVLRHHLSNWRLALLPSETRATKQVLGQWVRWQTWRTGQQAPAVPTEPGPDGRFIDNSGTESVLASHVYVGKNTTGSPTVALLGKEVSRNKAQCVTTLLLPKGQGKDSSEGKDEATPKIVFNPRSGMVPLADAVVLFLNTEPASSKYANKWTDGGRVLSWFVLSEEWGEGTSHLARLMQQRPGRAFLFARRRHRDPYIYCGRCHVVAVGDRAPTLELSARFVQVSLLLEDFDALQAMPPDEECGGQSHGHGTGSRTELALRAQQAAETTTDDNLLVDRAGKAQESRGLVDAVAARVLMGDVIGALVKACDAHGIPLERRKLHEARTLLLCLLQQGDTKEASEARRIVENHDLPLE